MRKTLTGVLAAAVVAGSLAMAPTAHAAPASVSPAGPMRFENFNFSDRIAGGVPRPVVLQKKQGNAWKTISSGKTASNGAFRFTIKTGNPSETLRGFSPRTTYKGRVYSQVGTTPTTVRTVTQTATLSTATTAVTGRTITATAVSSPARAGRGVELQILNGKSWQTIASGKVGANGRGTFRKTAGKPGTYSYRILMSAFNGAGRMGSAPVKVTVNNGIGITDPGFLKCIDEAYEIPAGAQISAAEAADTSELGCAAHSIKSIKGIQAFNTLEVLDLGDNLFSDVSPLKGITSLDALRLDNNRIQSIDSLKSLRSLTILSVANNQLNSVDAVSSMPDLEALDFSSNAITDLASFTNLTALRIIDLRHNQISDPAPLQGHTLLKPANTFLSYNPYCTTQPKPIVDSYAKAVCATNTIPDWNSQISRAVDYTDSRTDSPLDAHR